MKTQDELKSQLKLIQAKQLNASKVNLTQSSEDNIYALAKEARELQMQIEDMHIPMKLKRKYRP